MRYVILVFALIHCSTMKGQIPVPNAGFEKPDTASNTNSMNWIAGGSIDACFIDNKVVYEGKFSMKMSRSTTSGKGFFYQNTALRSKELSKFKISCVVKTTDLKGKAGFGARVFDKDGKSISGYNAVTVTRDLDFQVLEGEFYSDETADSVRIFGNIEGSGNAWFDNIIIEEIPLGQNETAENVTAYIREYFEFVRKYSVVRDSSYISLLEQNTKKLCAGHADLAYCHNILKRYSTLKLKDGHSFFWTPAEWEDYRKGSNNSNLGGHINFPQGKMTDDHVAYINVSTFASLDTTITQQYVDSLQSLIKSLDIQHPAGWIIDLSANGGGNSFPMLSGLGPLLGNGVCGYSQSADGSQRTRIYNNGWVGWYPDTVLIQKAPVYQLIHKDPPIAVIYGTATGSSGEVVAISFRGKGNTKSFGQETAGATTRIDNLILSDGASLNLACGWGVDRTGTVYKGPVPPDIVSQNHTQALTAATKWILENRK